MGRRKQTRNRTRIFVVQDKSGSMSYRRAETISGFNEYVNDMKKDKSDEAFLSLIQFDTRVQDVYLNKPIDEAPLLTDDTFVPGGMTALRDGVGRAVSTAEKSVGKGDKVLFVIMTDGGENSSREYSHEAILRQIEGKRKDGWEFVFLGAGEEAWAAGQQVFGGVIPNTHTLNYSAIDAHDHTSGYGALSGSTRNFRSAPAATASAAFDPTTKTVMENKAKAEVNK